MEASVGVCACNDEKNIGLLLDSLSFNSENISDIIVVASGCVDRTEAIVKEKKKEDKRIVLLTQKTKEGKASAVNLIIRKSGSDVVVLIGADLSIEKNTVKEILKPFSNKRVGMVGGRPVPKNRESSFSGFFVNLQWRLHHKISEKNPKMGEIVAFRKVGTIPLNTAVDEAYIEAMIRKKGYSVVYAKDAVVYNRGPETIGEIITQRKRIFIGHMDLEKREGYRTSTMDMVFVLRLLLGEITRAPLSLHLFIGCFLLEAYIRISAFFDYHVLGINPYNWDVCDSTKEIA